MGTFWGKFRLRPSTRDEPESVVCRFKLPAYQLQASKLPDLGPVLEHCRKLTPDPTACLRHIVDYLQVANSVVIDAGRRSRLLRRCVRIVAPACQTTYVKYYKGEAIPESLERKQALLAAVNVLRELNYGFKRVLQEDLHAKRRIFRRLRIRRNAQFSMELFCAEQRFRALRYLGFEPVDWCDCNQLFFALLDSVGVDWRFHALGFVSGKLPRGDKQRSKPTLTSVHQLYIAIQLFGLLDHRALSTRQLQIAQNIIDNLAPNLVSSTDLKHLSLRNVAYVAEKLDRAPVFYEAVNRYGRFRYLDLSAIRLELRREHRQLRNQLLMKDIAVNTDVKTTGSNKEDMDQLMALAALLNGFVLKRRKEAREYFANHYQQVKVCSGFRATFEILQDSKTKQLLRQNAGLKLTDRLSKYSTIFVEAPDAQGEFGGWRVLNDSVGGVLVETEESSQIRRMFIGQLSLVGRVTAASNELSVGYVTRLLRCPGNKMQVSIRKFKETVEAVLVQTAFLEKNAMVLPALFLTEDEKDSKLVMHYSHRMTPGQQLVMLKQGRRYEGFIREIVELHKEFVTYRFMPFEALVKDPLSDVQVVGPALDVEPAI